MGHSVGDAAKRSVERSQKKKEEVLTFASALKHIRDGVAQGIFVPLDRWKMLLNEYDILQERFDALTAENNDLRAEVKTKQEETQNEKASGGVADDGINWLDPNFSL